MAESNSGQKELTYETSPIEALDAQVSLTFYYFVSSNTPRLNVYIKVDNSLYKIATLESCRQSADWEKRVETFKSPGKSFKVVFKADVDDGNIALDDITVVSFDKSKDHSYYKTLDYCSFEQDLCKWKSPTTIKWKATKQRKYITDDSIDTDESRGASNVHRTVAVANSENLATEKLAILDMGVHLEESGNDICVTFYTNFPDIDATTSDLDVILLDSSQSLLLWSSRERPEYKNGEWERTEIEVEGLKTYSKLSFAARLRPGNIKGVAIDHVRIARGHCPFDNLRDKIEEGMVGFNCTIDDEFSVCGWHTFYAGTDTQSWIPTGHGSGVEELPNTGARTDHTYGAPYHEWDDPPSFFLQFPMLGMDLYRRSGNIVRLISPTVPGNVEGYCFRFWYHMWGSDIDALRIRQRVMSYTLPIAIRPLYTGHVIWELKGEQGNEWREAKITINSRNNFELIMEGQRKDSKTSNNAMGLDDLSISIGPCKAQ